MPKYAKYIGELKKDSYRGRSFDATGQTTGQSIDMAINVRKSCCLRIGARRDKLCSRTHTLDGREFDSVNEFRYLGVWSFYRAANGIFAKVGRLASEEVMVQLLKQECLFILLYPLDVCNLDKRSMQSLDFTMNRFLMQLFKTSNMEIVNYCQTLYGCELPSTLLKERFQKFIAAL